MTNNPKLFYAQKPFVDNNKRQDNPLWLQMWQDNRSADFHQTKVNPLLSQYWHRQHLKKNSRILVPLCGKSLDMLWLAQQGHNVVGIELSQIAVKAFFNENHLNVKKTRIGKFTCWQSGAIIIWCGDFFSLEKHQLGRIDGVFDRAALTALPESIRSQYVTQLRLLIEDSGVFLLSIEDVAKDSGQSINQIDSEITTLYSEHFDIKLTHGLRHEETSLNSSEQTFYIDTKVYQLSQRISE